MPKRIVDGEGVWRSDKIARIKPDWMRAEYTNLLPLALANGVFELDSRRIWSLVYSYNRPDITLADVEQILNEFERVKLLFRWSDETGKDWGYWVGIEKSGRLPAQSRIQRKEQFCGPEVPRDQLNEFIRTQYVRNTCLGSGSGSGSGKNIIVPENRGDSASPEDRRRDKVLSLPLPDPEDQVIARVGAFYVEKLGKNPKLLSLTDKRKQKARARYRECLKKTEGNAEKAEELMQITIETLAGSAYHREHGYDSWERNLFPNQEKLEWWLNQSNLKKEGIS